MSRHTHLDVPREEEETFQLVGRRFQRDVYTKSQRRPVKIKREKSGNTRFP